MKKDEAKYIIKELKSKGMYAQKREEYMNSYQEVSEKIDKLYRPNCPQASSGEKVSSSKSKDEVFFELLEQKDFAKKMFLHYSERLHIVQSLEAVVYYEDDGFARDFFKCSDKTNDMNYRKLESKYNVSNAYSAMVWRICKNSKNFSKLNA